jgi:hypothetical protein
MNGDLEQRFIELQRHANELEHLLVEEKNKVLILINWKRAISLQFLFKRDAYVKELHDRSRDDRSNSLKHKFDQIQVRKKNLFHHLFY